MISEDAKVSSFSSDFQTLSKIILIPCTNWVRRLFRRLRIEFFPLVYGSYNSHVTINQQENQGSVFLLLLSMGKGGPIFKYDPQYLNLEMLVFKERGNQSTRGQTSRSKGENQQQTQSIYGIHAGIWTWATLVGGKRSHLCPSLLLCYQSIYFIILLFIQTGFLCSTPATTHMIMIFIHKCKKQICAQKNNKLNVMIHKITGFKRKTFGLL